MVTLSWDQVRAWRLERHHLLRRAPRSRLAEVVARMSGVHAQMLSAAELSLAARIDGLTAADVRRALWDRRTLVKTWGMRGTLHLFPARDFPLWVAALRTRRVHEREAWLRWFGVTLEQMEDVTESVGAVLGATPMTREELAERVAARNGAVNRQRMLSGWGSLFKPAAFRGYLCFGPNRGQHVTFVRPDRWLGLRTDGDAAEAMTDILRRYLTAYGPATHQEFALWWGGGTGRAPARRLMQSISDDLVEVDVEGSRRWALKRDIPRLRATQPTKSVRLLPNFDVYTLWYKPREQFVDAAHAPRVFRQAAWVSPVLLVDGRAAGVWELRRQGRGTVARVEPFGRTTAALRRGVGHEVERLETFLGGSIRVEFGEIAGR